MKSATRLLVTGGMTALALLGGVNGAQAVPITPVVSSWTVAATSSGSVPDPAGGLLFDFALDVQSSPAVQAAVSKTIAGAPETADGRAEATIDPSDFNQSVVKSRSKVSTASSPPPNLEFGMRDGSIGGLSATLSTVGLAPGDTATVDLLLNVTGSLIYGDPGGTASSTSICDPFDPTICDIVPHMSASVSLLLALAEVTSVIDPSLPLPFVPLFNGSATLASTGGGAAPALVRESDWANPARDGDFQFSTTCNATSCRVDVDLSLVFTDVQSLGFGDTFDVGLLLLTGADALSDPGRMIESNFFDTASVEVTLTAVQSAVPVPGSLLLLAAGLMGIAVGRRARRFR